MPLPVCSIHGGTGIRRRPARAAAAPLRRAGEAAPALLPRAEHAAHGSSLARDGDQWPGGGGARQAECPSGGGRCRRPRCRVLTSPYPRAALAGFMAKTSDLSDLERLIELGAMADRMSPKAGTAAAAAAGAATPLPRSAAEAASAALASGAAAAEGKPEKEKQNETIKTLLTSLDPAAALTLIGLGLLGGPEGSRAGGSGTAAAGARDLEGQKGHFLRALPMSFFRHQLGDASAPCSNACGRHQRTHLPVSAHAFGLLQGGCVGLGGLRND